MPEDEFWRFIAVPDRSTDADAVERLTAALRAGGRRKAVGFAERLAATLYELDREVSCHQPVRWFDEPADEPPIPLSDDSFLYLRAAVVAQGRAVLERVLADPAALLTRPWDDGEALLYAAEDAAGGEIETKFSYETGSDEEHWSRDDVDPETHETPIVAVLLSDLSHPIVEGAAAAGGTAVAGRDRLPGRAAGGPRQAGRPGAGRCRLDTTQLSGSSHNLRHRHPPSRTIIEAVARVAQPRARVTAHERG